MNLRKYESCCGAGILHNLDVVYSSQSPFVFDPEKTLDTLKKVILKGKGRNWGLLTAITNKNQQAFGKLLHVCGFRRKTLFTNPNNGGAELKFWALDLNNVTEESLKEVKLPPDFTWEY